jgi:YgiT-type zinc finger domain-containing protein
MKTTKNSKKLCETCGGRNTKTYLTTFPIKVGEKQVNVGRVSVRECTDCHAIKPTEAGQEKIGRCMMSFMSLFEDNNFNSV